MTSLHQAVGQLLLGKVFGTTLDAENRNLLREGTMSGVTIFKDNAYQLHQLLQLVDDIRAASAVSPVITIDQEGGAVQRLDHVIAPIPSMMSLGKLESAADVFEVAKLAGQQLAILGINVVLAPVLDVNTNKSNPIIGSRAFGDDPLLVASRGEALARGYASVGVLPVGKHFPGHGDTSVDSHLKLPVIEHDLARLEAVELLPFRRTSSFLPGILTSHVRVPVLDDQPFPASLSRRITTEWLREKLGFEGLIFTDDMLMKAIIDNWGIEEACLLAVEAGADQLLVCAEPDVVQRVHTCIMNAVGSGRITESRIAESVDRRNRRVASVCDRHIFDGAQDARILRLHDLILRATELTEKITTTAIRNSCSGRITWTDDVVKVVVPAHPRYSMNFAAQLREVSHSINIEEVRYQVNPDSDEIDRVVRMCEAEKCALFTFRAPLNAGQFFLAEELRKRSVPWLLVAVDTPYDLENITGWQNSVAMYDPSDFAVQCFARLVCDAVTTNLLES